MFLFFFSSEYLKTLRYRDKRVGYKINIMRQTAYLVHDPIMNEVLLSSW